MNEGKCPSRHGEIAAHAKRIDKKRNDSVEMVQKFFSDPNTLQQLRGFALQICRGNADEADDIIQDMVRNVLQAAEKGKTFDSEKFSITYCYTTIRNRFLTLEEKKRRARDRFVPLETPLGSEDSRLLQEVIPDASQPSADILLLREEGKIALETFLKKLPEMFKKRNPKNRLSDDMLSQIIDLHFREGLSEEKIAKKFGMRRSPIKTALTKMKRLMRIHVHNRFANAEK